MNNDNLIYAFVRFLEEYYADWKRGNGAMSKERVDKGLSSFVNKCGEDIEFLEELYLGYPGIEMILSPDVELPLNPIMINSKDFIVSLIRRRGKNEEESSITNEFVIKNDNKRAESVSAVMDVIEFCEYTKIPKNSLYQKQYRDNNDINSLMVGGGVKGAKYQFIREKVYERYGKL